MELSIPDIVCCPKCKNRLILLKDQVDPAIPEGALSCSHCQKRYPLTKGIVNFLQGDENMQLSKRFKIMRSIYASIYTPATNLLFIPCGGAKNARLEVLDRLEMPSSAKVLETGIGTGDNIPFLKKMSSNCSIFGIDIQLKSLQTCRRRLDKRNMNADLFLADALELPFNDKSFDVVFHLGAFNLFSDKKKAIEEMIRVAMPGTKIVIADESQKGARFFNIFVGSQEEVVPPVDLVPATMEDIKLDIIWRGYGYVISFRTPAK